MSIVVIGHLFLPKMPALFLRFAAQRATALAQRVHVSTYPLRVPCTAVPHDQTSMFAFNSTFTFCPFSLPSCRWDCSQGSTRLVRTQAETGRESPWRSEHEEEWTKASGTGTRGQTKSEQDMKSLSGRKGGISVAVKEGSAISNASCSADEEKEGPRTSKSHAEGASDQSSKDARERHDDPTTGRGGEEKRGVCGTEGEKEEFSVDVEVTPNPLARKFFVNGASLLPLDTDTFASKSFSKRDKYDNVPLIKSLFELSDVTSILVAKNYLTIVKNRRDDAWEELERKVRTCLLRHLKAGDVPLLKLSLSSGGPEPSLGVQQEQPSSKETASGGRAGATQSGKESTPVNGEEDIVSTNKRDDSSNQNNEDDEEVEEAIKSLLYLRARPMLLADGGDLEVMRFDADTGIVWVYLKGSCQGCPSSLITVKRGMKQMLQYYIPEVEDVRQCDENGDPLEEEDEE